MSAFYDRGPVRLGCRSFIGTSAQQRFQSYGVGGGEKLCLVRLTGARARDLGHPRIFRARNEHSRRFAVSLGMMFCRLF